MTAALALPAPAFAAPKSATLLIADAKAAEAKGDMQAALDTAAQAVAKARTSKDKAVLATALRLHADYLSGYDVPAAIAALKEVVALRETLDIRAFTRGDDKGSLGTLMTMAGDTANGLPMMRVGVAQMAGDAQSVDERENTAFGWVMIGQNEQMLGHPDAAQDNMARALKDLDAITAPTVTSSMALTNIADFFIRAGDGPRAIAVSRRALEIRAKTQAPDHPDVIDGIGVAGDAEFRFGDLTRAEQLFRRAVSLVNASNLVQPAMATRAYQNLGKYYMQIGRPELAAPLFHKGSEMIATKTGASDFSAQLRFASAQAADAAGDTATATADGGIAVTEARKPGVNPMVLATILLWQAERMTSAGDLKGARSAADEAGAIFTKALKPENPRHGDAMMISAGILDSSGDLPAAVARYDAALTAMAPRAASNPTLIAARIRAARAHLRADRDPGAAYALARQAADAETETLTSQSNIAGATFGQSRLAGFNIALDSAWAKAGRR